MPLATASLSFAQDQPRNIHFISHFFHGRGYHAAELNFANAKGTALSRLAQPAKEESRKLPKRIEAEASRHYGITLEVTRKEPQIRFNIEFSDHFSKSRGTAILGNLGDPIEHQHGRQGQLGISWPEEFTSSTCQEFVEVVARFLRGHSRLPS